MIYPMAQQHSFRISELYPLGLSTCKSVVPRAILVIFTPRIVHKEITINLDWELINNNNFHSKHKGEASVMQAWNHNILTYLNIIYHTWPTCIIGFDTGVIERLL